MTTLFLTLISVNSIHLITIIVTIFASLLLLHAFINRKDVIEYFKMFFR